MASDKGNKKTTAEVKVALKPKDPFIRAENEDDDGYDPRAAVRARPLGLTCDACFTEALRSS